MEYNEEKLLFYCSIVGLIADVVAIFLGIVGVISAPSIVVLTVLVVVTTIACKKYYKKCEFLSFIQYLFDNPRHNFTSLPKTCLILEKTKENNNLHVREMRIKYHYNMSGIEVSSLSKDSPISYIDTIEYNLNAANKKIPEEFSCYLGNMYAKGNAGKLSQKHGVQTEYEVVPLPRYTDETRSTSVIQRFAWQLKKENITKGKYIPINFKAEYIETTRANSNDTLIVYPRQFAKKIDVIHFEIKFSGKPNALKKIEFFKVGKDGQTFKHIPIETLRINNDSACTSIEPDTSKYEAYYFRVYWELVE